MLFNCESETIAHLKRLVQYIHTYIHTHTHTHTYILNNNAFTYCREHEKSIKRKNHKCYLNPHDLVAKHNEEFHEWLKEHVSIGYFL